MDVLVNQQLTWPNALVQIADSIRTPSTCPTSLMASMPVASYVSHSSLVPFPDAELQLQEDQFGLRESDQGGDLCPPGVQILCQWREHAFPEGKHQGSTFISVHNKDPKYVAYMKGHTNLTLPWASFSKAMAQPTEVLSCL